MKKTKQSKMSKQPGHWAQCFLEQAARETSWIGEFAEQCDYLAAHNANIRRGVWLQAALLAQEQKK